MNRAGSSSRQFSLSKRNTNVSAADCRVLVVPEDTNLGEVAQVRQNLGRRRDYSRRAAKNYAWSGDGELRSDHLQIGDSIGQFHWRDGFT